MLVRRFNLLVPGAAGCKLEVLVFFSQRGFPIMSREYAEARIREALRLAKGNTTRARQQIIAWTFEDPKLLQALARPHMTGIVAHAIGRVVHMEEMEGAEPPDMPEGLNMAPESFGKEILSALRGGEAPTFGLESGASAPPQRRGQASKSHIEALKRIARESKNHNPDRKRGG